MVRCRAPSWRSPSAGRGRGAALDAVTDPELDQRRVVVTERRLPGVPRLTPGAPAGWARIVSYEPDEVAIDARLTRAGVVVLGDNWFPGWKAEVDGEPVEVERVDYVLRGAGRGPRTPPGGVLLSARQLADRLDHQPALAAGADRGGAGGPAQARVGDPMIATGLLLPALP